MQEIRQSSEIKVRIGDAMDATDGVTPETELSLATADQTELLKHNGAATVDISANTFAAVTGCDGWYDLTLTAGNTDTLGQLTAVIQDSSLMRPIFRDFMVVTQNYWDSKYSTDRLQVDVRELGDANLALTTQMKADVNTECDTALTGYDAPTKTEMDTSFNSVVTAVDAILLDTGTNGVLLAASATSAQLVDDVWDELLTGGTHNIASSAGRRVREIGAFAIHSGTAQAGNSMSITLAASADANDGVYNRNLIVLTDNNGVGQTRTIVDYDGISKVVVVDREWRVHPDNTTAYQIVPDDTPLTVDHGLAIAGTATTITIRPYASSVDNAYLCNIVAIIAGTGRGQARLVGSYDGTTNVITICGDDWTTTPDTTSVYVMMPYGATCASCLTSGALAQINAQVADVLKTDTIAEMAQGALPASPTFEQAINYLYRKLRNKTETTTTEDAIYDDAGTTKLYKAGISDDGNTFAKGEYGSGA